MPPPLNGPMPEPGPFGAGPALGAAPGGGFVVAGPPGMTPLPSAVGASPIGAPIAAPIGAGPGPGQLLLGGSNMDAEAARQALIARARGGTIPMGAGLDAIVRQIHEDAARDGVPLDPSLRNLAGTPPQMQAQLQMQMAGSAAAPAAPARSNGGIVALMVLVSIVLGVGAGFVAYIVSR